MTQPFVTQLRARQNTIRLAPEGAAFITIRVEMPEVWDVVRIETSPNEGVLTVKRRALDALYPGVERHEEFVLKFRGWEILDESATLADAGLTDGSILLLTYRSKRPVR
jgi:hypothetical protein